MQKMKNTLFAMDGIVTDVQFTFSGDAVNSYHGKTVFVLNGKELSLETPSNLPPFKTSTHLVLAVKRTDDNSLHVIACYIKNARVFVDTDNGLGLLVLTLLFPVIGGLWLINEFIKSIIQKDFFEGLLLIFFGIFCLLILVQLLFKFLEYRKALKVINHRLHRISLLKKRSRIVLQTP
jgi:hypothetical protein